jgi:hypothetical protein
MTARTGRSFATLAAALTASAISAAPQPGALTLRDAFNGADRTFGAMPPDLSIAAGPASIVMATNDGVTIRDKVGTLIARAELNAFFNSVRPDDRERLIDVSIHYDAADGRFFIAACGAVRNAPGCTTDNCVAHEFVAVSKSDNPRSTTADDWHFYALDSTLEAGVRTAEFPDHARIGGNEHVTVLVTDPLRFADHGNQHARIRVMPKSPMLRGEPVTWTDLLDLREPGTANVRAQQFYPVVHSRPTPTGTFFLINASTCDFGVWGLESALSAPQLAYRRATAASRVCRQPSDAPQPDSPIMLAVDERPTLMFWPTYASGTIWAVEQIRRSYASGDVAAVRVVAIDVSGWPDAVTITQDMTLAEENVWKFFPALTADAGGNVAIVFGQSSRTEYASTYITGRLASDPPNTLRPARLLKAGTGALTWGASAGKVQYGDYFGAAIDPSDGTAWVLGEYVIDADRWGSWIGNVDWGVDAGQ